KVDERRKPVSIAEEGGDGKEPSRGEKQNTRLGEGLEDGVIADFFLGLEFGRKLGVEPVAFVGRKPARFGWAIGEEKEYDETKDDGRDSFEDEKPAPSGELQPMDAEQRASERRAQQR